MKPLQAWLTREGHDPSSLRVLSRANGAAITGLTVEGYEALDVWARFRSAAPALGLWPVLVGREGDDDLSARLDRRGGAASQLLADAQGLAFGAWVEQEHADLVARSREELARAEQAGDEECARSLRKQLKRRAPWQCMRRAEWPTDAEPTEAWMVARLLTHDEVDDPLVTLALVPASRGWEALAVLNFGSQWQFPRQAVHAAAWRHWEQAHGAEVVSVTWDTVEATVGRPPTTRRAALELARAQCLYCPDLETQVYKSVDALAARLLRGEAWYFWWD